MKVDITRDMIIGAIRAERGVMNRVATAVGLSRQGLNARIQSDAEVQALIKECRRPLVTSVTEALQSAKLDPDEVAVKALTAGSERAAVRALLVEHVSDVMRRPQREVIRMMHEPAAAELLEKLLPAPPADDRPYTELLSVSMSVRQLGWLRSKGKGFAAQMLDGLKGYPAAKETSTAGFQQTSFKVSNDSIKALKKEAERQGVSPSTLFRTIVERAIVADERKTNREARGSNSTAPAM